MSPLRAILVTSTVSALCAVLVDCGGDNGNEGDPVTGTANDSGTDAPSVSDDGSATSNDSSTDSSMVGDASDASSDADAGPVFSASCSGSVTTPFPFDWTYDVTDQGSQSQANATVTPQGQAQCSGNGTFTNSLEPLGARDKVVFPCTNATWSMALNRTTKVVYIVADNGVNTPFSWTPNCN